MSGKKFVLPDELTLNYRTWICGFPSISGEPDAQHGVGDTRLLNKYGYMCCLGQFAHQSGMPKEELSDSSTPCDCSSIVKTLVSYATTHNSKFSEKATHINDDRTLKIPDKMKRLRTLCHKYRRKLHFKNFPKKYLKDIDPRDE